jgi:LPS O-antigen subunit length determinant protein (WzzB/FepE family)
MANETQTKSFEYDVFDLSKFAWEKRKTLITITFAAFVISIIVSLIIKPNFKAKVILFPTAEISMSKSLVETSVGSNNEKDVLTFGNDIEAERLLQVLRSDQLIDHLIEKFNLLKYYDIKNKYPYTTVKGILGSNIKCRRTEYNSIEILVFDHNPELAAKIANEIGNYADTIICTRQRAKEAYDIVIDEYNSTQQYISFTTDSLNKIRAYGITDYKAQASALNKAYAKSIIKKNSEAIKAIENKLAILQKYGGEYDELHLRLKNDILRLSYLKGKLVAAKVNYEHKFSSVFVVDKAIKPEKKDGPKRLIIILLSTISTFAITLLALIVTNKSKNRF